MAQNSIRIGATKKIKIEVNDDGDYITLDFADGTFAKRFKDYARLIEKSGEEYKETVNAINSTANTEESDEKIYEADYVFNKKLAEGLEVLFGVGTCKKVFGHDTPSADAIAELLDALTPYIVEYSRNRKSSISNKYGAHRKGGK